MSDIVLTISGRTEYLIGSASNPNIDGGISNGSDNGTFKYFPNLERDSYYPQLDSYELRAIADKLDSLNGGSDEL